MATIRAPRPKTSGPAIAELASTVFDNRRRGMPRPGCDCVQCFGYCLVDQDEALRDAIRRTIGAPRNE